MYAMMPAENAKRQPNSLSDMNGMNKRSARIEKVRSTDGPELLKDLPSPAVAAFMDTDHDIPVEHCVPPLCGIESTPKGIAKALNKWHAFLEQVRDTTG